MDLLVLGATAYRCRTRIARRFWPKGRFAPRRIMPNRLASPSATLAIWLRRRSRILGQRPRAAGRARASYETGSLAVGRPRGRAGPPWGWPSLCPAGEGRVTFAWG